MPFSRRQFIGSMVGFCALAPNAWAQTFLGEQPGTEPWSDPSNWSPTAVPLSAPSTRLTFTHAPFVIYNAVNDLPGTFELNRLTLLGAPIGEFPLQQTISGNPLRLVSDGAELPRVVFDSARSSYLLTTPVELTADTTVDTASSAGAVLRFGGPLNGAGAFVKTGGGTVEYTSPANATFTGGADLRGGTTRIVSAAGAIPQFGTATITLRNGATMSAASPNPSIRWNINNPIIIESAGRLHTAATEVQVSSDVVLRGELTIDTYSYVHMTAGQLVLDGGASATGLNKVRTVQSGAGLRRPIVDAPGNAAPLRLGGSFAITSTGNTYQGGTILEPGAGVLVEVNSSLGTGGVVVQRAAGLRLQALSNLAPGRKILIEPGGGAGFDVPMDATRLALIDPTSRGVITGDVTPGLNLAGYEGLFVGSDVHHPFTPAGNVYRIGGVGDLGTARLNNQGSGTPILSGNNAAILGTGVDTNTIRFESANTYTGGTTVNRSLVYAHATGAFGSGGFVANQSTIYARGDALFPGISPVLNECLLWLDSPAAFNNVTGRNSHMLFPAGTTLAGTLSLEDNASVGTEETITWPVSVRNGGAFFVDVISGQVPRITSTITVTGDSILRFVGQVNGSGADLLYTGLIRDGEPGAAGGFVALDGGAGVTLAGPPAQYAKPVDIRRKVTMAGDGVLGTGPVSIENSAGLLKIDGAPRALPGALTVYGRVDLNSFDFTTAGGLGGGSIHGFGRLGNLAGARDGSRGTLRVDGPLFGPGRDQILIINAPIMLQTGSLARAELDLDDPHLSDLLRLDADSSLSIGNDVELVLSRRDSQTLGGLTAFTLVDNQSLGSILGTFEGLPEGALIPTAFGEFRISYAGGDGNDLVLNAVPEPTSVALAGAAAVLASRRRGRLRS